MARRPLLDRLMAKRVVDESGCWLWLGAKTPGGYGYIRSGDSANRMRYTHRAAYEALVGEIPDGLQIDHLCRVRACFNPEHLEPVTQRENVMRSQNPIASNPYKKACPSGHPYDDENTYYYRGTRQCRLCRNRHRENHRRRAA